MRVAWAWAWVLSDEINAVLASVDAVVEPTVPIAPPSLVDAPGLGSRLVAHTRLANMTGLPAISLPLSTAGGPVGLHLTGTWSGDLLELAALVEESMGGPPRLP